MLSGGLDFMHLAIYGESVAQQIEYPKASGMSPLIMFLLAFGFLSVLMLYWSSKHLETKIGQKQFWFGFIGTWIVIICITIIWRFTLAEPVYSFALVYI